MSAASGWDHLGLWFMYMWRQCRGVFGCFRSPEKKSRYRVRSLWTGENSRPMEYKLRSTRILESDDTRPTFSELREPSYPV
ncbi:uncharacterized protein ASPGLDRAFT_46554, partial [Aspergillus glaucus CBS 516.65]